MIIIEWIILDNSNIVESYPEITLPLSYSFAKEAYAGVFKGIIGAGIKNSKITGDFDVIFKNMIHSYNGRIYYILNNWYALLTILPASKKIIPVWQEMMGVNDKQYPIKSEKIPKFGLFDKIKVYKNLIFNFVNVPKEMEKLNRDFLNIQNYFKENYKDNAENFELFEIYRQIEKRVLEKWYVTLFNDLYAFLWTGALKSRLKKKGCNDGEVAEYISGLSGLESLKPIKEMLRLAKKYGGDKEFLINHDKKRNSEIDEYIEIYGDRSICELKLETETYRENPRLLFEKIAEYAEDEEKLDEMIAGLSQSSPAHKGFILKRVQAGIKNREISRLNRSRIYGMVRRIFKKIGENLEKGGVINNANDIFYLTIDEIFSENYSKLNDRIEKRKNEYREYKNISAFSRIVFRVNNKGEWGEPVTDSERTAADGIIQGTGTSSGRVTGEAVVLLNPEEKTDVKNKIIVTKTTDPGWVFLLTSAKGIIAEKGSLLSHTAIVSRELNIPAVVGVNNAVKIIKTGDIITIDGGTGVVEFVRDGMLQK